MADDNVIDIGSWKPKRPDTVYECMCGSQLFYVLDADMFRCYNCSTIFDIDMGDDDE